MRGTIGIDPGNDAGGVSLWHGGTCISSTAVNPWRTNVASLLYWPTGLEDWDVYVEVPQNGTHKSRGGVHFAAGMLVAQVCTAVSVKRKWVKKVTPNEWRKGVLGGIRLSKKQAVERAQHWAPSRTQGRKKIEDHNEAEAILIGAYGEIKKGNKLR